MVVLLCNLTNLPQTKAALNQMTKVVEVMAVIDLNTVHPVIMTKIVTATVQRKKSEEGAESEDDRNKCCHWSTQQTEHLKICKSRGIPINREDHVKDTPIKHLHRAWQN